MFLNSVAIVFSEGWGVEQQQCRAGCDIVFRVRDESPVACVGWLISSNPWEGALSRPVQPLKGMISYSYLLGSGYP